MQKIVDVIKNILIYGAALSSILVLVLGFIYPDNVGRAINALLDSNSRVERAVDRVAEETALTKQEVSDDPIIQLQNRGYSFSQSDFYRAIDNGDSNTVRLFCEAAPDAWVQSELFVTNQDLQSNVISELRNCKAVDVSHICDVEKWYTKLHVEVDWNNDLKRRISNFCGEQSVAMLQVAERKAREEIRASKVSLCQAHANNLRKIAAQIKSLNYSFEEKKDAIADELLFLEGIRLTQNECGAGRNGCWRILEIRNKYADANGVIDWCTDFGVNLIEVGLSSIR